MVFTLDVNQDKLSAIANNTTTVGANITAGLATQGNTIGSIIALLVQVILLVLALGILSGFALTFLNLAWEFIASAKKIGGGY